MTQICVQFTDSAQATVAAYFAGPQDSTTYPNQGTVQSSDAKWKTFYDSLPVGSTIGLPSPD